MISRLRHSTEMEIKCDLAGVSELLEFYQKRLKELGLEKHFNGTIEEFIACAKSIPGFWVTDHLNQLSSSECIP